MKSLIFILLVNCLSQSIRAQNSPNQLPAGYPQPTQTQLPRSELGSVGTKAETQTNVRLGERDPFSPPKYISDMEQIRPEDIIDNRMEAIRRWPLAEYKLRGIIWDVKNPKAMIIDKTNTLHLLKKNYRIGHREGLISEINESEIIVLQKGVPVVMQIEKQDAIQPATPEVQK